MIAKQSPKAWLIGGGVIGALLTLVAYMMFISPQRDATDQARSDVTAAQDQNNVLEQRLTFLAAQNKSIAKFTADLDNAREALPADSGMPAFLHSLQSICDATSTTMTSFTVGSAIGVTPAGATSAAPSPSPSSSASSTASATTSTAAPTPGVFSVPVNVVITGSLAGLNRFLYQLQSDQPRAVLITQLAEGNSLTGSTSAVTTTTGSSLTLSMQVFVAPGAAATPAVTPTASTAP